MKAPLYSMGTDCPLTLSECTSPSAKSRGQVVSCVRQREPDGRRAAEAPLAIFEREVQGVPDVADARRSLSRLFEGEPVLGGSWLLFFHRWFLAGAGEEQCQGYEGDPPEGGR